MAELKTKRVSKPPIRLVWAEASSITPNPRNWRTHPEAQLRAVRSMIDDEGIGWAGACLFNDQTGRLIDGHGRLKTCKPDDVVPVLVGSWSEDKEAQILARLDPSTMMAGVDTAALTSLLSDFDISGEDFAELDAMVLELAEGETSDDPAGTSGRGGEREASDKEKNIGALYQVVAHCNDGQEQQRAYDLLTEAGISCRVNTINP